MNIVHYSLGFPPFRTGGMIKYCMDLMTEEAKAGHNVYLLWPGKIKKFSENMYIKIHKDYNNTNHNVFIHNVEIINPLPVPLLNGIKEFNEFIRYKKVNAIYKFLKENNIDVLHVHTLMGLPIEIIKACKELKVKTIFTTHDYFGICPRWGLEKDGKACLNDHDCKDCIKCNKNALSLKKIKFLQSNLYKILKNSFVFKLLRRRNNSKLYIEEIDDEDGNVDKSLHKKYQELRKYYVTMLESFDVIHYNSNNTQKIYSQYIKNNLSKVIISISHSSIKENKKIKRVDNSIIKIGYLGPITKHKGFFFLKDVCDELYCETNKFELHIFANFEEKLPYLKVHSPYKYGDLENVMEKFDILVCPSLWNETFGFTVLEALSYGKPIIATENVGAKDLIIPEKSGFVVKCENKDLKEKLKDLINKPEKIENMNNYIFNNVGIKTIREHTKEIINVYKL